MKKSKHQNGNEQVVITNPETGETITTTLKAFESLYSPKGYEMTTQVAEVIEREIDNTPKPKMKGDEGLTIKNPTTGQVLETTIKSFETLYQHKGFQIVSRNNIDDNGDRKSAKTLKRQPISSTGSAAGVAVALGLDKTDDQDPATPKATLPPATTPEPTLPAGNNEPDESETGPTNAVTPERGSNRRDRGRTS